MTLATLLFLLPTSAATPGETLAIGDPAPAIQVAEWVKGEPIAAFRPGQVYVVEFWATWCGPCKKSIPHVSELQKNYGEKVRFLGVSVWERDASGVTPFVQKMGDKMAYTVARDLVPDGKEANEGWMARNWMEAAQQGGIPAAFIVDGTGRIAWIGHPMEMDAVLGKVVAGTWDVAAAKAEQQAQAALAATYEKINAAIQGEEWASVVTLVDETIATAPDTTATLGPWKFIGQLHLGKMDEGYAFAAKLVDGAAKDSAEALNQIAWTIVDPDASWPKRDHALALRAAERANQLTEEKNPSILDTLALVHFGLGHIDQALALQKKAVELTPADDPTRADLEKRLRQFEEASKQTEG
jgi:thiol-disulfide isomerase/thioredoxin